MSILISIRKSETTTAVLGMTPIFIVNIPWSITKRSIPSPSPINSPLSAKRYGVFTIRDTKLRCCNERDVIRFSHRSFTNFGLQF